MAQKSFYRRWIKWPVLVLLVLMGLFFGLFGSVYIGLWGPVPSQKELAHLSQQEASQVFSSDSSLIGKFFITNREAIEFKDLPPQLIHALIATEDARFYEHHGIDERSLLRVFFKSILLGDRSSGGGSTITQQLAKNLYGRKDYGYFGIVINKLRESIVANRLEDIYTKDQILTLYFNTVPFSGNTYGIESAAEKFFNTKTSNLTLSQAATLVGTLKANHSYNPRLFPERSQLRRDVVLQQMVKYGYLSPTKAHRVMAQKIQIDYHNYASQNGIAPYFKQQVRTRLHKIFNKKEYRKPDGTRYHLKTDGLKIYTTLDLAMQKAAQKAMRQHMEQLQKQFEKSYGQHPPWRPHSPVMRHAIRRLPQYKKLKAKGLHKEAIIDSLQIKKNTELFHWEENEVQSVSVIDSLRHYLKFLNTGFIALAPKTGAIRAYIGGIDYRFFQYDHVVQSRREVGSTFKPFVYTAAVENGLSPCDYISVRPVTYTDQNHWTPKNAEKDLDPDLNFSLTAALAQSLNTIAVKVLRKTGIQKVIAQVHKMGIPEKIKPVPSIALGTSDLRVIDLAKAYSCFLNDGRPTTPFFIERVTDKDDNLLYQAPDTAEKPAAFSEQTREIMLQILQQVVNKGTGRRLRYRYHFKNDIAGKTGTTQNNTDGWFVGLLPHLVTVTWVGNDNHSIKFKTTALGQGANSALPLFAGFLKQMNQNPHFKRITQGHFKRPSPQVSAAMDCPPTKRNGFFKRLFQKNNVKKKFKKHKKKKKKKKKGFFKRLFGGGKK